MVFGTFRIYGYRLCFAVRGFRKRCSRARFRDSFAACFAVRGFRACVLLFEAFGSDVPKARFREAQKIVFVDSKGNVKEFFGSGFGRFRLVSRWCLGIFASKATACVLLFEAFGSGVLRPDFATGFFGSGFGRFRLVSRWCLGLFTSKATACVLPFEAFGPVFCCSRLSEAVSRPDFGRPIRLFLKIPKVTWKSFLAWVLAVFGACPDGVWDFSHLRLALVFCCSRLSEAVFYG